VQTRGLLDRRREKIKLKLPNSLWRCRTGRTKDLIRRADPPTSLVTLEDAALTRREIDILDPYLNRLVYL
jgi:hypothetical protein